MITITISNTIASKVGGSGGAPPVPVPPTNTVAPSVTGSPVVGETLLCSTGTWTGTAPITYTYQWVRDTTNISGATSDSYVLVDADATFIVYCVVTATNIVGSANVNSDSNYILDADANAFLTATAITDNTLVVATNELVVDLKGYSLWTKYVGLYPFIGGTATTHKYNLKDPLDTNAAFRIEWIGGVTHNSNGITGNGTNGYGETYIKPNTNLALNSTHIAFWSKTNSQNANAEMGIQDGALNASLRIISRNTGNNAVYSVNDNTGGVVSGITDSTGFWITSRTASNARKLYRNGVAINSGTTVSVARTGSTIPVLGQKTATNTMGAYLAKNFIFASAGQGLNDTEAANYYTAVNKFNTSIGR